MSETPKVASSDDEKPPIFETWNPLYLLVLAIHAFTIFLFYVFTNVYS